MSSSEEFLVPILIENNSINPIFVKANSILLNKFEESLKLISTVELKKEKLQELWEMEHSACLIEDKNLKIYNFISFKNDQTKTLFLLKHGGL
jgi:hypothetical protein